MKTSAVNRIGRSAVLAVILAITLWLANVFESQIEPKTQGWVLISLTAIFAVSEAFFWKALDGLSSLPTADRTSAEESAQLSGRVQTLKQSLRSRWFMLLGLKIAAGAAGAFLANQTAHTDFQNFLWLLGVGALVISLPLALTFFYNWLQADELLTKQQIEAKRRKERLEASVSLSKEPPKPLNADKMLQGYSKVVSGAKNSTPKQ